MYFYYSLSCYYSTKLLFVNNYRKMNSYDNNCQNKSMQRKILIESFKLIK